jgi:hypothetical protein
VLENQPCQRLEIPGSSRRAGEKGIEPDSDLHPKVDLLSAASDGLGREGAVLACHQVERTAHARSSGSVDPFGDKRKKSAFVEITLCANRLLVAHSARILTVGSQMFLRQITHMSPSLAKDRADRES